MSLTADTMSDRANEEDIIRRTFNEIPPNTRRAYRKCIHSEALFKFALPCGTIAAGLGILNIGGIGKGTIALVTLAGFALGVSKYSHICLQRHAPHVAELINQLHKSRTQNVKLLGIDDESVNQESMEDNFNTSFSDNDNQFHVDSIFEEDKIMDKPVDSKPRVTYDGLLKQHRSMYPTTELPWYEERPKPVNRPPPKQEKQSSEDTFKPKTTEDNIWI